ncbi:DNA polymerase III subunit alpha [Dehalogenimonas sp. THU2]|uniref:DNA polymerase III subunit alpha n=1 Tax=Dehalogenimonas sp. THU2 TaxID=3151121 RepID=UPI0032188039
MSTYSELHCHSYYSFHDGASSLEELLVQSKELGYEALAVTDHDNLCGAMRFAHLAGSLEMKGIVGAEVTLKGGYHLTLLVENREGYKNLCRLITAAAEAGERNTPELPPERLAEHASGLIVLSGCPKGELSQLLMAERFDEARGLIRQYLDWFGSANYYIELQHNRVYGDRARNKKLVELAAELGARVVATGNVHYHVRDRHQLQDCLVAVKHCKNLDASHRERRPNSEFYLRPVAEIEALFEGCPEALANTVTIAGRCSFDLTSELNYTFPDYPAPDGQTPESYLENLCLEAAVRRYGGVTPEVRTRLDEEFRLVKKHRLAGFLLLYHDVIKLGREAMIDLGLADLSQSLEENPPGRGRGSSVALLIGYLIGLSHIDPLKYRLSLERFLPDDTMSGAPDIDLDFPRSIREELILRTHRKWGWRHAALAGTIATYQVRGAVRDLGKALSLPPEEIGQLAKQLDWGSARKLSTSMDKSPHFRDKVKAPVWRDLVRLAWELDGFPKYMGQHPGGMIISSTPLTDLVPVQRGAIDGRYVCQWDKDSIDDAGFVKIDFLALGALSQLQEADGLIKKRTGRVIDLSRIDFDDPAVYDMLCRGDTIGIFQVESAAQMQTITRLRPRNLFDMAHEVGAVRPGVGVNGGVQDYLARRSGRKKVVFDHTLEEHALARTLGVVLFQDQVNQLAIDVAGFGPGKADQLRRAFGRRHNEALLARYRQEFMAGAAERGVDEAVAAKIFHKFNGQYMFPESHAFAFGVTAYQASWLKLYYPLEFFVAIFNQQPMGFYNLETLKEDARRHGVAVLNPDINKSSAVCVIEGQAVRLGFLHVHGLGGAAAGAIEDARAGGGPFLGIGDFMERSGVLEETALRLTGGGAFDAMETNRRKVKWEIGLRYRPVNSQMALPLPVRQDMAELAGLNDWERMQEEYSVLSLFPAGHIMASVRPRFNGRGVSRSSDIERMDDGTELTVAGLVIRRQRPRGKVVFITLEDEFGHIPLMVFPQVYERQELKFRSPFLIVKGRLSRREGAHNVVVSQVTLFAALDKVPVSKDWR